MSVRGIPISLNRSRREFLKILGTGAFGFCLSGCRGGADRTGANILLITADDLNWDTPGCFGNKIPDITPNIDRLADEGMRFARGHVNIAVCQPCRQSILTGLYAYRHGGEGFHPVADGVPTLIEELKRTGWLTGILGKEKHAKPDAKFPWDFVAGEKDLASGLGIGRSPERYHDSALKFFQEARRKAKPFFLNANAHDPHRPFAGSVGESRNWGEALPHMARRILPNAVDVPGFLPDIPDVREEVAQYMTSAFRADQVVGGVLQALDEAGLSDDTLVLFLSDNGMSFPFAKANCYLNSTLTPWIIRWPGRIEPGALNEEDFISTIDIMPTILEIADLASPGDMDGRSFLPLLMGARGRGRTEVFTEFHETFGRNRYPMRSVIRGIYGYIVNFWADGETAMRMDSTGGLTFRAMMRAAETDSAIARRVALFSHRTREEFYDYAADPNALNNLIDDPRYIGEIDDLRHLMEENMARTGDPALEAFRQRNDPAAVAEFMEVQRERSRKLRGSSRP